ncbi:MAG: aldehyde dehydrogenase family protein [Acidiferrobacterales bacterium]
MQQTVTTPDSQVDNIKELYQRARKAFEEYQNWPQEKVDMVCQAVGWEISKPETAEKLARLAVDESGIGVFEDKFHKVQNKTRGTMRDQLGARTCDLVEENKDTGIRKYAKPYGVVANVVPCTNPESTVCCIGLALLKTRNAMIVSPHPRTPGSSALTVEHIRKALRTVGAPEDLVLCIKQPSHEKTKELMERCDFAVATGGAALIRVVYEAGTPCHTVGAGNVVSIIDSTVDLKTTAGKIVKSKCANNSASCSSENAVAIEASVYEEMLEALKDQGGYLCSTEEREKLRAYYWPDGKHLNRDLVAKPATWIAEKAGLHVPEGTRFLMVIGEKIGPEDRFSGEKISPTLTVWKWDDFSEMCDRLDRILAFSGMGHSTSLHSEKDERRVELALKTKVGRVNCNMPHAAANSGSWFNGQLTTDTLGCGSWAGNMTSDNIDWRHFLNYTWLSVPIPEHIPSDEELFGNYLNQYGKD